MTDQKHQMISCHILSEKKCVREEASVGVNVINPTNVVLKIDWSNGMIQGPLTVEIKDSQKGTL